MSNDTTAQFTVETDTSAFDAAALTYEQSVKILEKANQGQVQSYEKLESALTRVGNIRKKSARDVEKLEDLISKKRLEVQAATERGELDIAEAARKKIDSSKILLKIERDNLNILERQTDELEKFTRLQASAEGKQVRVSINASRRDNAAVSSALATTEDLAAADALNTRVRREVGLIGDVDAALVTLGQNGLGQVAASAEAALQILPAIKGLPAAFTAVKESVGIGGLAAGGGLLAGLGLLTIAMDALNKKSKEAKENIENEVASAATIASQVAKARAEGTAEAFDSAFESTTQRIKELQDQIERFNPAKTFLEENQSAFIGAALDDSVANGRPRERLRLESSDVFDTANLDFDTIFENPKFALEQLKETVDPLEQELRELTIVQEELSASSIDLNIVYGETLAAQKETTEALLERVASERNLAEEQNRLRELNAEALQETLEETAVQIDLVKGSLDSLKSSGDTSEDVREEVETLNDELKLLSQTYREISSGLLEEVVLRETLLDLTEQDRLFKLEEQTLLAQSSDSLEKKALALETEIEANEAAIEALKASGDTSEQVAEQIKAYDDATKDLAKTLDIITNTALPEAQSREAEEEAEKEREKSLKKVNELEEKVAKDTLRFAQQREDAQTKLNDNLAKLARKQADARLDAEIDLGRDIADAIEEAENDVKKARGSFDFAEIFDIKEGLAEEVEERKEQYGEQLDDLERSGVEERRELRFQLANRLRDIATAERRATELIAAEKAKQLELIRNGLQAETAALSGAPVTSANDISNTGITQYRFPEARGERTESQQLASIQIDVNGVTDPEVVGEMVVSKLNGILN